MCINITIKVLKYLKRTCTCMCSLETRRFLPVTFSSLYMLSDLLYFPAYTYSLTCPPEFPLVIKSCYGQFKTNHLVMYHRLLAVIKSTKEGLVRYCR